MVIQRLCNDLCSLMEKPNGGSKCIQEFKRYASSSLCNIVKFLEHVVHTKSCFKLYFLVKGHEFEDDIPLIYELLEDLICQHIDEFDKNMEEHHLFPISYLRKLTIWFAIELPEVSIYTSMLENRILSLYQNKRKGFSSMIKELSEWGTVSEQNRKTMVSISTSLLLFDEAKKFVAIEPNQLAKTYVECLLKLEPPNIEQAYHCITQYRLYSKFGHVVEQFRATRIQQLVERGKHSDALVIVENHRRPAIVSFFLSLISDSSFHERCRKRLAGELDDFTPDDQYLYLDQQNIIWVSEEKSADLFRKDLKSLPRVIGLDTEWKPDTSKFATHPTSVLQVATSPDRVYVVDMSFMFGYRQLFNDFTIVMASDDVIKVGFDFAGDMKRLTHFYPESRKWTVKNNFVDLSRDFLPGKKQYSLRDLSLHFLGKNMDKFEQCSDWDARPLRASQLQYAAVDAWALVIIHEKLFHNNFLGRFAENARQVAKLDNKSVAHMIPIQDAPTTNHLKSLAFVACNNPKRCIIAVVHQNSRVDEAKLELEIGEEIRKATEQELTHQFRYACGSVGPMGIDEVYFDQGVLDLSPPVYMGAGSREYFLETHHVMDLFPHACICDIAIVQSEKVQNPPEVSRAAEKRFLVDNMLGKVGKLLRMTGVDCLYCSDLGGIVSSIDTLRDDATLDPAERKRLTNARRTQELRRIREYVHANNRIFLTTDTKAAQLRDNRFYILTKCGSERNAQFRDVCEYFDIRLDRQEFLARCVKCNGYGFDDISKESIFQLKEDQPETFDYVPTEILERMNVFYVCRNEKCKAIFWEGPKFDKCCKDFEFLYKEN